ncbi:TonB-dependent receptor [Nguyenibacter vanlangensis]|uniref:TonB-dependent receptor n=1 Tax=Nguyenibacter vanlangensis TaxID=1216886 RepID=A0ABZ3D8E2_9PROT
MSSRFIFGLLVASTALSSSILAAGAQAQTAAPVTQHHPRHRHAPAGPVRKTAAPVAAPAGAPVAASTPAARHVAAAAPAPKAEDIVVTSHNPVASANGVTGLAPGGGMMSVETEAKAVTTVSRDFIAKLAPATSAAQMIQFAPGTNIGSSDPFGLSDQTSINVRGMNQSEIGYLFEGAPVADIATYDPYTSEWGDTENYEEVQLSQGTSDVNAPLVNATGGQMNVTTIDPSHTFGGLMDYSYGSHKTNRGFIRINTGDILNTGVRGFVSYSNATYGTWRGPGRGMRRHVDSKFVKEWGEGNSISFVETYNENNQPNYAPVTAQQWKQYGDSYNYSPYPFQSTAAGSYWVTEVGDWRNMILVAPMHFTLTRKLSLLVEPYFYWGSGGGGMGQWDMPINNYNPSTGQNENLVLPYPGLAYNDAGTPSFHGEGYYMIKEFHPGINAHLEYQLDHHNKLTLGAFHDYYDDAEWTNISQLGPNGDPPNTWGSYGLKFQNGYEFNLFLNYHLITQSTGLYVSDSSSWLDDRLKVEAGFKYVMMNRQGTNNYDNAQPYNVGVNYTAPLPRVAASYKIDDHNQVYFDAAANFRMPLASSYFSGIPGNSPGIGGSIKPEFAISEELGYRHYGLFNLTVSLFNYNFTNRNITTSVVINGSSFGGVGVNAGGQTVRGADIEFGLRPWHHISPYVSAEYLYARTDNNLPAVAENGVVDYLPTTGKRAPQAPEFTTSAALSYDDSTFFGNFMYRWIDKQYSDFMDQESLPAHGQIDMTLGYRLPNVWRLKHPQIQLNMYNLASWHYRSSVQSLSNNTNPVTGVYGNLIDSAGAPTYLIAPNFAAMFTVTAGF